MLTIQELRSSTLKELRQELASAQKELQHLRISVRTKNQKDISLVSKQKHYVARIQTLLKEIELETLAEQATQVTP
ncbi:MAG: 50S ribosomal protein L29 [Candidatus Peregrinibacteria bacterium]